MDSLEKISPFLYYTYLPFYEPEQAADILPGVDFEHDVPDKSIRCMDDSEMIAYGIQLLKSTFSKIIQNTRAEYHIVPLSGGMDSRGILASLMDAGLKEQIIAVTFGVPGAWDYELGRGLAQNFGINHRQINLMNVEVSTDKLLETAQGGSAWTFLLDAFYNSLIPAEFGDSVVYWSGFMGDTLAGGSRKRLPVKQNKSWQDAIEWFAVRRNVIRRTINMASPDYDPVSSLPVDPIIPRGKISYLDQIMFWILNANYLNRVVTIKGFNYVTPYRSPEWVKFVLSLSRQNRLDRSMYLKILGNAYPDYFSYPTSQYNGASLNSSRLRKYFQQFLCKASKSIAVSDPIWNRIGIYENLKYINYDASIRERDDFKRLITENINDLKKRKVIDWFDPGQIWKDHMDHKGNLGIALVLLTALEISLKSDERSP